MKIFFFFFFLTFFCLFSSAYGDSEQSSIHDEQTNKETILISDVKEKTDFLEPAKLEVTLERSEDLIKELTEWIEELYHLAFAIQKTSDPKKLKKLKNDLDHIEEKYKEKKVLLRKNITPNVYKDTITDVKKPEDQLNDLEEERKEVKKIIHFYRSKLTNKEDIDKLLRCIDLFEILLDDIRKERRIAQELFDEEKVEENENKKKSKKPQYVFDGQEYEQLQANMDLTESIIGNLQGEYDIKAKLLRGQNDQKKDLFDKIKKNEYSARLLEKEIEQKKKRQTEIQGEMDHMAKLDQINPFPIKIDV